MEMDDLRWAYDEPYNGFDDIIGLCPFLVAGTHDVTVCLYMARLLGDQLKEVKLNIVLATLCSGIARGEQY